MHRGDFEGPPLQWSVISILGGVATAVALILGLEMVAQQQRNVLSTQTESAEFIASPSLQP